MLNRLWKFSQEIIAEFKTNNSFTQNFAISFSGTAIAQGLGFLLTPFIARIYGPSVYGLFALFISIVGNISPLAVLQFPTGYVAARDQNEFLNLVRISFFFLFIFTISVWSLTFFFQGQLLDLFNAFELKPFTFLLPIYLFLMGFDQILLGWNIRLKGFKRGAASKIVSTLSSKGLTIIFGLLYAPVPLGMILGNLLVYPFESLVKLNLLMRQELVLLFKKFTWKPHLETFKKFRTYPYFLTPGVIVNNLSNQLPIYSFSIYFTQTIVGYFALATSLVTMPVSIITSSSTTVFLQKAAELFHDKPAQLKTAVQLLYRRLFMISVLPLFVFALLSKWIFIIIFGLEWSQAGMFASLLAMGSVFSIPANPLSVLFRIMHRERLNFFINLIFLVVKFAALWLGVKNENMFVSVLGFSLAGLFGNATQVLVIFRMMELGVKRLLVDFGIVIFLFALVITLSLK